MKDNSGYIKGKGLLKALQKIPRNLKAKTPEELEEMFNPSKVERALRLRYWELIYLSTFSGKPFKLSDLCKGICSYQHIWQNVASNPIAVAWITSIPRDINIQIRALGNLISRKLRQILSTDIYDQSGKVDSKRAELFLKTYEYLENFLL